MHCWIVVAVLLSSDKSGYGISKLNTCEFMVSYLSLGVDLRFEWNVITVHVSGIYTVVKLWFVMLASNEHDDTMTTNIDEFCLNVNSIIIIVMLKTVM